jgi:two-component system response regulator FlrC
MKTKILIVDDDYHMRVALKETLKKVGLCVASVEDGKKAVEAIKREGIDLIITDVKMPVLNGIDLLKYVKKSYPFLPVVLITAYGTIQDAVQVMKEGAFDYIQKPFDAETLYSVVKRALSINGGRIIFSSKAMREVIQKAKLVAPSDTTVFILGESGVGKELVSRYIHEHSSRRDNPLVPINCAALPENLLESELFGYEKGAFTGASQKKLGKFEVAHRGTILLDEVTEMDLRLQAKLLRALQEKEIEVIGSKYPKKVDVRVIATTNRDIKRLVNEGKFREDLYYRLNVFPVYVPSLRDRWEDIPELIEHFLKKHSKGMDIRIDGEAMTFLMNHSWKGNVRELENAIARACILSNYSLIKLSHVVDIDSFKDDDTSPSDLPGPVSVKEMETRLIIDALKTCNGNRTKAASLLGITVRTLRNKLKEYRAMGIDIPERRY